MDETNFENDKKENLQDYSHKIKTLLEKYKFKDVQKDRKIGDTEVDFYAENPDLKRKLIIEVVKGAYTGSVMRMKNIKSKNKSIMNKFFGDDSCEYILFSPYFPDSDNAVNTALKNGICIYKNELELESAIKKHSKR